MTAESRQLLLVSAGSDSLEDKSVLEYARMFLGVPIHVLRASDADALRDEIARLGSSGAVCLAMSADTLVRLGTGRGGSPAEIGDGSEEILIYGCTASNEHSRALKDMTRGAVTGVETATSPAGELGFSRDSREWTGQFSGIRSSMNRAIAMPCFEIAPEAENVVSLMTLGGSPVFIRVELEGRRLALAGGMIPDMKTPLSIDKGMDHYYESLVPLQIFLRGSFKEACWHGAGSGARLVIDDPLIRPRYGHLEYLRLLNSMKRSGFGTSIAFIPWNHRRTKPNHGQAICGDPETLSVCIHGCDHTYDEFGTKDQDTLGLKAALSMKRMHQHRERTGVPFERVMVFPQGRFSRESAGVLRANGYLAAVDSNCLPCDDYDGGAVTIRDLMFPAVTRFSGFPIFKRHYPLRLVDFAFGLFVGRPAFIAAHHHDFSDGGERIEKFIKELTGVFPDLEWLPLTDQVTRTCVIRSSPGNSREVRFFTREFVWNNPWEETTVRFEKHEPEENRIDSVLVNGEPVSFEVKHGLLRFESRLDSRGARISVVDQATPEPRPRSLGLKYGARVAARRWSSEFRDHTLSRHPWALQFASKILRTVGVLSQPGKKT